MATIGLRELRQAASEVLRRVEAGETTTVTVAGRTVATIVPVRSAPWTTWDLAAATHRVGREAASRTMDLLIAATAHAHGARLVTANPADVEHLGELVEIVPVELPAS